MSNNNKNNYFKKIIWFLDFEKIIWLLDFEKIIWFLDFEKIIWSRNLGGQGTISSSIPYFL